MLEESSSIAPRSYYGAAKCAVEHLFRAYHAQTGHTVLIVRPPNIYGPGQLPKRQFGIVPTLMRCAQDGTEFEIWGDGSTIRDFLYIDDFERFIGGAAQSGLAPIKLRVFQLPGAAHR